MKRTIITFVAGIATALVVPVSGSPSSSTWRVVKSTTVSGQFAPTGISATIRHPKGIAVRLVGTGVHGTAGWGCSKGVSISFSAWRRIYGRGLHVLRHVAGQDSCDVVASISGRPRGRGRVTVQILKWA